MIGTTKPILQAWWNLLNGNTSDIVYMVNVPALNTPDKYYVIRAESETNESNKSAFIKNPVVIVEKVAKFSTIIDYTTVETMDDEINALLYNSPSSNNLSVSGLQLVDIDAGTPQYLEEDDGVTKIHRKITRYIHQTIQ